MELAFLRPEAFFWILLAVPLFAAYLRRDRMARHVVAAHWLWQMAIGGAPARWLRWRRAASLAVQFSILLLIVLAMAEPACGDLSPWWPSLALLAAAALVVEWRLFQRRWTC